MLDENEKRAEFSNIFMLLPSTLDRKGEVMQWKDHANLHRVDVSIDELKEFNGNQDFNSAILDSKELRGNLTGLFYKFRKKIGEISDNNLVRNSDAYLTSGGKIDPEFEFFWIDNSYKEAK